MAKKIIKGLTIIYTGCGKGKTTAALGLALRAAGYNKKTLIIQFGKKSFSGEMESIKLLAPLVKLVQGGKGFVGILGDKLNLEEHKSAAKKTFEILKKEIISDKWDIIVADEVLGVILGGLIKEQQLIKLIKTKPKKLDLVLTGRGASDLIIQNTDLVTEMKSIKHPYEKGIKAKEGIDY